jgi:glycosyltransferase involved in cell wall biosynthesis
MKVALFLGRNAPIDSGGTYSFERQLLVSLALFKESSSHEFYIFGWNQDVPPEILGASHIHFIGNLEKMKFQSTIKIIKPMYIKIFKSKFRSQIELAKVLLRLITRESSKIMKEMITHKIDMAWTLGLDCPAMGIPYIATVWDLQHRVQPYYPEVSSANQWLLRENFYSETLRRATFLVTGTKAGKAEIEKFFNIPSEKIKILSFPTPRFALKALPCSEIDKDKILKKYSIDQEYLFYPAQLWPHKNHVGLLLALKSLKENHNISVLAIFAGSNKGNYTFLKQKVTEFNLSDQVRFIGFVSQGDLIRLYQNALALTFVTYAGPDNLPPLEAFALGCPVIASKVSGAEEQLGDAAILVDPKSSEEIALAIKAIKEDPDLRQTLISRGLARASQWTGNDYIRGICSILDEFAPIRSCWSSEEPYDIRATSFDTIQQ